MGQEWGALSRLFSTGKKRLVNERDLRLREETKLRIKSGYCHNIKRYCAFVTKQARLPRRDSLVEFPSIDVDEARVEHRQTIAITVANIDVLAGDVLPCFTSKAGTTRKHRKELGTYFVCAVVSDGVGVQNVSIYLTTKDCGTNLVRFPKLSSSPPRTAKLFYSVVQSWCVQYRSCAYARLGETSDSADFRGCLASRWRQVQYFSSTGSEETHNGNREYDGLYRVFICCTSPGKSDECSRLQNASLWWLNVIFIQRRRSLFAATDSQNVSTTVPRTVFW